MTKMCTSLALTFLLTLSLTAKADDKCSTLQSNRNAASASVQSGHTDFNKAAVVWNNFCTGFKIQTECLQMLSIMNEVSPETYNAKALPILKSAARHAYMNSRELGAYKGLADTLRDSNLSIEYWKKKSSELSAKLVSTKCDKALGFIAMSDTALISKAAQKDAIGSCQVVPLKNSDKYSILISDVAYPIAGATYSSISEMAAALREAVDAGLCKL